MAMTWQYLDRVLREPEKYGDFTQKFINYMPDDGFVEFPWKVTFSKDNQFAMTELNLDWKPFLLPAEEDDGKDEMEVYLIASQATEFELSLRGFVGYHYLASNLKKYNRELYSNRKLGMKGFGLTKWMISCIPPEFRKKGLSYWVPEHVPHEADTPYECSSWAVDENGEFQKVCLTRDKETFCEQLAILPAVHVPSNIMVCLGDRAHDGSSPKKALNLKVLRSTSVKA